MKGREGRGEKDVQKMKGRKGMERRKNMKGIKEKEGRVKEGNGILRKQG